MGSQQLLIGSRGPGIAPGVITLNDQLFNHVMPGNNIGQVGYELTNVGVVNEFLYYTGSLATRNPIENWVAPVSAASLFEVFVSHVGGPAYGTFDTWMPLTTTYLWYAEAKHGIYSPDLVGLNVTIRRIGQTTPEETAYIDLRVYA